MVPDRNEIKFKTRVIENWASNSVSISLNATDNTFSMHNPGKYRISNVVNSQVVNPTGATITCWVWSNTYDQRPTKYGDFNWAINGGNGTQLFYIEGTIWPKVEIPRVPINQWYYMTVVLSSGYLYFFVNGSLYGTISHPVSSQVPYDMIDFVVSTNDNLAIYKDVVAVRTSLWTSNFTPPDFNTPLLDLDPSLEITKNMLIPYPFDDILKVY